MQGRQLLYVKELYLFTSLLSNKACSCFFVFFIYFIFLFIYNEVLIFCWGFLVLSGRFVGVGGCSCILSGCVCCCMGWECGVIVLVLSISVGSLLCWDGDVGSSRLVLWAGRLMVTLLS